jgi:hypothetical protein
MATLILEIEEYKGAVPVWGYIKLNESNEPQSVDNVNLEELARYKELYKFLQEQTKEWYKNNAPELIQERLTGTPRTLVESSSPISNGSY